MKSIYGYVHTTNFIFPCSGSLYDYMLANKVKISYALANHELSPPNSEEVERFNQLISWSYQVSIFSTIIIYLLKSNIRCNTYIKLRFFTGGAFGHFKGGCWLGFFFSKRMKMQFIEGGLLRVGTIFATVSGVQRKKCRVFFCPKNGVQGG